MHKGLKYTREWRVKVKVAQLCPTLFNPWNSSGQNTGMGRVAFPFSRGSPNPGIKPRSPTLQVDSLPVSGKPTQGNTGLQKKYYWLLVVQTVKNLPVVQETQVQSLDRNDPLQEEMATHSSILAWRIQWTEQHGLQRTGHDWMINTFTFSLSPKRLSTYFPLSLQLRIYSHWSS